LCAEFRVEDDLPQYLAQGVFTPGRTYPAYIRFSNGDPDPNRDDAKGDARGMAIKLLEVQGEKILPDERDAQTQDFIMINHPVFFIDNPAHYLGLIQRSGSSNPFALIGQLYHGARSVRRESFVHALARAAAASPARLSEPHSAGRLPDHFQVAS
jgi:catalase